MLLRFLPSYAADGGASGTDDDDPDERVRSEDIISRSTNAQDTIARLGRELDRNEDRRFKQRAAKRVLQAELDELKGRIPADGSRVLTADEAPLWEAYTALGKPDALKQAIDANGEAATKLAKLERSERLRKAADVSGYEPSVLEQLAGDLVIETREVDGKPAAFVKDDKGERLLTEHAPVAWPKFMPALQAAPAQGGTSYVAQSAGDKAAPPQNPAQAYINRNYNKGAP